VNQKLTRTLETIRQDYLRTKFVRKMEKAHTSRKAKDARESRLEGFAEMERLAMVEERRRSQASADIDDICNAMKESEAMKAQIAANEREKEEVRKAREVAAKAAKAAKAEEASKARRIAGKKRKSDAAEERIETRLDLAGRPYIPRHKRSKTEVHVDSDNDSEDAYKPHQVRYTHARQQQVGMSLFSRTRSAYGMRRSSESVPHGAVDTTQTDYFRLKALGINPDTPVIPLTAAQLQRQREQAQAERDRLAAEPKPWEGNSSLMRLSSGLHVSHFGMPPPAKPLPRPLLATKKPEPTTATSSVNDLLDKLKKFNKDRSADADWFKARREELELEDAVEDPIQVHQTIERRDSSQTGSSPLMRSSSGYDFVPAETKPGHTLSRTEERIRRTGAHGLATAPIGGTPGYVKPEMSYLERQARNGLNGLAGSRQGDATANRETSQEDQSADEFFSGAAFQRPPNGKGKERATEDLHQQGLQEDGQSSEEEYYSGEYEEDETDMDDEEDLEDEYDEDEDAGQAGPSNRGQYLSATPASRGASAEDAINLDSD
jgi:hypothetical protein